VCVSGARARDAARPTPRTASRRQFRLQARTTDRRPTQSTVGSPRDLSPQARGQSRALRALAPGPLALARPLPSGRVAGRVPTPEGSTGAAALPQRARQEARLGQRASAGSSLACSRSRNERPGGGHADCGTRTCSQPVIRLASAPANGALGVARHEGSTLLAKREDPRCASSESLEGVNSRIRDVPRRPTSTWSASAQARGPGRQNLARRRARSPRPQPQLCSAACSSRSQQGLGERAGAPNPIPACTWARAAARWRP